MLLQKIDGQWPCFCRCFLIAHTVSRINESMTGIVDFDREIFACRLVQLLDLLNLIWRNTLILTSIDSQYRSVNLRNLFGRRIITSTIESHHRAQVSIARCNDKGHKATYAETHQA